MENEFKRIKYKIFENAEIENDDRVQPEDLNKSLVTNVKHIPRLSISEMIGFEKDLLRMKIDVFGLPETNKTSFIQKIVYDSNNSDEQNDQEIIKYSWIPNNELAGGHMQIDLWNIPHVIFKSLPFVHLSQSGIVLVIWKTNGDMIENMGIIKKLYQNRRNIKIVVVILPGKGKNTEDTIGSQDEIEENLRNFNFKFWRHYNDQVDKSQESSKELEYVEILFPIFVINDDSERQIKEFQKFLLKMCMKENPISYSNELILILTFIHQQRYQQNICLTKDQFQQNLEGFCKINFQDDPVPKLNDHLTNLLRLGEIFVRLINEESSQPSLIIQPIKYLEAVNILCSNPNNKILTVESKRFWRKTSNRPDSENLAKAIETSYCHHVFIDSMIPILLQKLQLKDAALHSILQLMIQEAVLIEANISHLNISLESIEMPFYSSFSEGKTFFTFNNSSIFTQDENSSASPNIEDNSYLMIRYSFQRSLYKFMHGSLICLIRNNVFPDKDSLKWIRNGLLYITDKLFIKIQYGLKTTFELNFYFLEDPTNLNLSTVFPIIIRVLFVVQHFVNKMYLNLHYNISASIKNSNKKILSVDVDKINLLNDAKPWIDKVSKMFSKHQSKDTYENSFKTENEVNKHSTIKAKESTHLKCQPIDKLEERASNKPNPNKFNSIKTAEFEIKLSSDKIVNNKFNRAMSITEDNEITPFDLRRSTCHELENLVTFNSMTADNEESYLMQIASSYIASIFTQAAVELMSLQMDDQHKSLNRDPLVVAAQRDLMTISANMANNIQSGDYQTSGRVVLSVANAVQRAIKRKDQYNNTAKSKLCNMM